MNYIILIDQHTFLGLTLRCLQCKIGQQTQRVWKAMLRKKISVAFVAQVNWIPKDTSELSQTSLIKHLNCTLGQTDRKKPIP